MDSFRAVTVIKIKRQFVRIEIDFAVEDGCSRIIDRSGQYETSRKNYAVKGGEIRVRAILNESPVLIVLGVFDDAPDTRVNRERPASFGTFQLIKFRIGGKSPLVLGIRPRQSEKRFEQVVAVEREGENLPALEISPKYSFFFSRS